MSIMADIKNVIRAAILPHSRGVFGRIPTIIGLPDQHRTIDTFPRSFVEWQEALKCPLAGYNQLPHVSSRNYDIRMDVAGRKFFEITNRQCPRSAPVHCEIKLLLHLFPEEQQSTNPKPAA